jgi:phosphoglycerol transferase
MISKLKKCAWLPYLVSLLVLTGVFFGVLHGQNFDLNIPFQYNSDTLQFILYIKTTLDTGWFLTNPALGAPGTYQLFDFPIINNVHIFIVKALALFSHNAFVLTNLSYLLGFILAAWSALFVYKKLELNTAYALVAGLLFTLLPYHFWQAEGHLFLSSYFAVPLWCLLAFSILNEQPFCPFKNRYGNALFLIILLECIVNSDAYYFFFGLFFVFFAGIIGSIALRKTKPFYRSFGIIILSMLIVAANLAPNALYIHEHGKNHEVAHRGFSESEVFGLQIAQMLLPVENHRNADLAHTRYRYNKETLQALPKMINENTSSALGIIASLGLLFSFSIVLVQSTCKRASNLYRAASFNILAILLAVPFGFSVLFGMFISPEIRTYTRISVFIGFLSLFVFFRCLQALTAKYQWNNWRVGLIACMLLAIGVFDQTTAKDVFPKVPTWKSEVMNDQVFVGQIEHLLPAQSMIFQLPYVDFPEGIAPGTMDSYAPLRPSFFSDDLRWSAGAMKGRPAAIWQKATASQPVPTMVKDLTTAGFAGIYIDRNGYADHGQALEARLAQRLHEQPLVSPNNEFSFFRLVKKD